jgi:hypothetical protein
MAEMVVAYLHLHAIGCHSLVRQSSYTGVVDQVVDLFRLFPDELRKLMNGLSISQMQVEPSSLHVLVYLVDEFDGALYPLLVSTPDYNIAVPFGQLYGCLLADAIVSPCDYSVFVGQVLLDETLTS